MVTGHLNEQTSVPKLLQTLIGYEQIFATLVHHAISSCLHQELPQYLFDRKKNLLERLIGNLNEQTLVQKLLQTLIDCEKILATLIHHTSSSGLYKEFLQYLLGRPSEVLERMVGHLNEQTSAQ